MAFKLKHKKSEFPFKKVNEALVEGAYPTDDDVPTPGSIWGSITSGLADIGGALAGQRLRKKKAKEAEDALKKEKNEELDDVKDGEDVVDENSNSGFTGTPSDIEAFKRNIEFQMKTQRSNERTK